VEDTTYGAEYKNGKSKPSMIRDASEYKIEKQY